MTVGYVSCTDNSTSKRILSGDAATQTPGVYASGIVRSTSLVAPNLQSSTRQPLETAFYLYFGQFLY